MELRHAEVDYNGLRRHSSDRFSKEGILARSFSECTRLNRD